MRAPSIGLLEQLKIGSVTVKTSLRWGRYADEALKIKNSKKLKCLHIFLEDRFIYNKLTIWLLLCIPTSDGCGVIDPTPRSSLLFYRPHKE